MDINLDKLDPNKFHLEMSVSTEKGFSLDLVRPVVPSDGPWYDKKTGEPVFFGRIEPMHRKGLTKLIEEIGELISILAKKDAFIDTDIHPDGKSLLSQRIGEEMGDVFASIEYCAEKLPLRFDIILAISENVINNAEQSCEDLGLQSALEHLLEHASSLLYQATRCRSGFFGRFVDQDCFQVEAGKVIAWMNILASQMEADCSMVKARKIEKLARFRAWDRQAI